MTIEILPGRRDLRLARLRRWAGRRSSRCRCLPLYLAAVAVLAAR